MSNYAARNLIIISLDITPGSNGYHDAPKNFLFQLALHAFLLQLPLYSIGNGDHCVRVPKVKFGDSQTFINEPDEALLLRLGPQEGQQVGVDLILMRGREAVRCARIVDFLCAPDELNRLHRRVLNGNDLVVLAVHDQGRDIDLLEVHLTEQIRDRSIE